MNENQKPTEEKPAGGGVKKFFKSRIFKWLLIIALEYAFALIAAQVFVKIRPTNGEFNFSAIPVPLIVFWVVCAVIAIPAAFKVIHGFMLWFHAPGPVKKQGVIRIITQEQYNREQFETASDKLIAFVVSFVLVFLFAPFIAPLGIGSKVHKLLNKLLK